MASSTTRPFRFLRARWVSGLFLVSGLAAAAPIKVGLEPKAEPFAFVRPDGQPDGFTIELLHEIAREQHLQFEFSVHPWADLFDGFVAGEQSIIVNIVHTPERSAQIDFSLPYSNLRSGVFTRKGSGIRTVADLKGRRFAVMSRGLSHDYVLQRGWADAEDLVIGSDVVDCMRLLDAGECDVVFGTELVLTQHIRDRNLRNVVLTDIDLPDLTYQLRFGVHRGDSALLFKINEGIAAARASGAFDRLHEKWLGPLQPRRLRFADLQPLFLPAAVTLTLVLAGLIWQRGLLFRLRRSEHRLKLVLDGGGHGFWDWDILRDRLNRNDESAAILGYSRAEIPPTRAGWRALVHPDDLDAFDRAVAALRDPQQRSIALEYRMRRKDGEWRWIFTAGRVLEHKAAGAGTRATGTHTDITERKRNEEERAAFQRNLLEAQKLEGLGLLAGGIAHDFNNLLAVILGNVTLLKVSPLDPDSVQRSYHQIETASRRAADLCRQMLAYAGRGQMTVETIDLNALVTETVELLRSSLDRCSHLHFDLQRPLAGVTGDPSQLRQVIMNLVLNAAESLPASGGRIDITTRESDLDDIALAAAIHGRTSAPGRYLCLDVKDNGSGISAETRAKIFNPFFTTKATGRGLGLAAVLGIVRSHRGVFFLDTSPGHGSRFSICLPAGPASVASAPVPASAPASAPRPPGARTLLVVDDEPHVLAMTATVLRHHGYQVVTAPDGSAAVREFAAGPDRFDAVLLDVTMPGLDGVATLERMRVLRPELPALLMSGFSTQDVLRRVPVERPPEFLQKPFAQDELLTCLNTLLNRPARP